MKSWFLKGTLAAIIAVPMLSGAASAGGTDDYGCSNATLKGEYAFGVTGYVPAPQVVAGIKIFDGQGNFSQRDYIGDSLRTMNQTDFAPKGQEQGTYTVNSDCTGSMVINLNATGPDGVHRGNNHRVRDQRRRPSYPRGRCGIHPAGIDYRTPAHPNQRRRLEGRVGSHLSDRLRSLDRRPCRAAVFARPYDCRIDMLTCSFGAFPGR